MARFGPRGERARCEYSEAVHTFRAEVLEELARHGLAPRRETSPQVVRDALRDLYKYEIRRLKQQLLAKQFPKAAYAGKVVELRRRYPLLSVPLAAWVCPPGE